MIVGEMLTAAEAAKILHISARKVYALAAAKLQTAIGKIGARKSHPEAKKKAA